MVCHYVVYDTVRLLWGCDGWMSAWSVAEFAALRNVPKSGWADGSGLSMNRPPPQMCVCVPVLGHGFTDSPSVALTCEPFIELGAWFAPAAVVCSAGSLEKSSD